MLSSLKHELTFICLSSWLERELLLLLLPQAWSSANLSILLKTHASHCHTRRRHHSLTNRDQSFESTPCPSRGLVQVLLLPRTAYKRHNTIPYRAILSFRAHHFLATSALELRRSRHRKPQVGSHRRLGRGNLPLLPYQRLLLGHPYRPMGLG